MSITGRIDRWFREQVTNKEFIIWGCIYNDIDERWRDGTYFHTSGIKNRKCKEGDVVETRNSRYELGKSLAEMINEKDT